MNFLVPSNVLYLLRESLFVFMITALHPPADDQTPTPDEPSPHMGDAPDFQMALMLSIDNICSIFTASFN